MTTANMDKSKTCLCRWVEAVEQRVETDILQRNGKLGACILTAEESLIRLGLTPNQRSAMRLAPDYVLPPPPRRGRAAGLPINVLLDATHWPPFPTRKCRSTPRTPGAEHCQTRQNIRAPRKIRLRAGSEQFACSGGISEVKRIQGDTVNEGKSPGQVKSRYRLKSRIFRGAHSLFQNLHRCSIAPERAAPMWIRE